MAFAIIAVLFSNVINLSWVICAFSFINFIALLNDDALLASTNAFIPFIIIPPWIIAKAGIALLFLIPSPDVAGPCFVVFNLFGKSAGKVYLILHSNLFHNLIITSISWGNNQS